MKRALTDKQVDAAVSAYEAGYSTVQIAECYGVCDKTIATRLRERGVVLAKRRKLDGDSEDVYRGGWRPVGGILRPCEVTR